MTSTDKPPSVTRATFWTIADFVADRGVGFVIVAVLARLVSPAEFGTVALLAVFIAVATVMAESGLGLALIQKPQIDDADMSSAFWMNIALAWIMTAILWGCGPLIADFFGRPVLVHLIQILALSIPIGALGTVQRALLLRSLDYKKLMVVRVVPTLIAGVSAIGLALAGFGVFALAAQTVVAAMLGSAVLWFVSPWRPQRRFDQNAARGLLRFGGYMLASTILDTIYSRAYTVFIGKMSSAATVGHYGRADATIALLQGFVSYPLNQMAFPMLSRMVGDSEAMGRALREGLKASMLVNAPAMLMVPVLAAPLTLLAYGPQWGGAVPFIQILALVGVLMPVHILNLRALMAKGNSNIFFWLEVAKKLVGITALFFGAQWGAIGLAWGAVVAGVIAAIINASLSQRMFGYGILLQARDVVMSLVLGLVMAGAGYGAMTVTKEAAPGALAQLLIGGIAGSGIWLLAILVFNPSGFRDLAIQALGHVGVIRRTQ